MQKTVIQNARDTALLDTFGPNPVTGFKTALATAATLDSVRPGAMIKEGVWNAQAYFDEIAGVSKVPVSERGDLFASAMQGLRHWMVATKMGSVLLSQVNDISTYATIAASDGLGIGKAMRFAASALNPLNSADKKAALRLGIATQTVINDVGLRYGEATKGTSFTSKMANLTVRLSGTEYWTESMKRGYQTLIAFHLHDAVQNGRESMGPDFNAMLRRYGIGDAEWRVIEQAQPVKLSGEYMITPVSIKGIEPKWTETPAKQAGDVFIEGMDKDKWSAAAQPDTVIDIMPEGRDVAVKVAAMMAEEADIAIVSPGARETSLLKNWTKPGTLSGEFMRSFSLFKTFATSISTKVLPRVFSVDQTGHFRAGLAAQFALGMIVAGGMSYQLKQIAFGRNPRDMTTPEFWLAAAAQSGGLGIFGDFMFSDVNRFGGDVISTVVGPIGGLINDSVELTIGNARQALMGKETHLAAETFQYFKNQGPLFNLWYTRAALDHLLFYKAQEAMNPGYLRRMKRRVENQNNQTHYWSPEDTLPEEAPDIGYAFGGSR
ncbi:MAG: hypothetical protein A2Z02_07300 [Chloroflexi bacterium RBG_16_48_7]|nr:MAG: hypothetical protein A2Z02_07300 [Chloroflexi bacterium RBG_16_48_7]